jgi:hypothetical protein
MINSKNVGLSLVLAYALFLPYEDHYITDWGNGVVTRGDRYVKSGDWAYNCVRRHLVSKIPRPFPTEDFKKNSDVEINTRLVPLDQKLATKEFIHHVMKNEKWYEKLQYILTFINEDSQLDAHYFGLSSIYKEKQWILRVIQSDNLNTYSSYSISADLYDARYHKNHEELLKEAKASCPKPQ